MLSKIKSYFFHLPLKTLLFIGKLQGLIVFETAPTYSISPLLCAYCSVYTVLIVISLQVLGMKILCEISYMFVSTKVVLIFVYAAENLITTYRVITVYIVQFWCRKNFRNILADAVNLHRSIQELMNGIPVFDRTIYRRYVSKVVGVFLQLISVTYIISLYRRITSTIFQSDILTFTLISYMHLTDITISGIFYAGMLFILMLYRNLNVKAGQITEALAVVKNNDKIKHRLCSQLGDEIDQICYIYDKASAFTKKFNKLFSLQLLFAILNTFFVILIELFYIYDNVREMRSKPDLWRILSGHIIKDFAFLSCYAIELYHNVSISCMVAKQARTTAITFRTLHHLNTPLKQNIELLAFQSLLVSPGVTPCGLFKFNSTFLFSMMATIASYLVILIQFDINDKTKSNVTLADDFDY